MATSVDGDSLLGSWVKVSGRGAAFRLKRPIGDGDLTGYDRKERRGSTC